MRKIYLFRHALPEFPGGVHVCLGITPDLPLSAEGTAAAAAWAAFLKEKGITGIYTSPALRCRETAAALSGGEFPVTVIDAFHEIDYGEWEGVAYEEIRTRYAALYVQRGADMSLMPPGGEPLEEAVERGTAALHSLLERTQGDVALVTHGGLSQALLWHICGKPLSGVRSYHMDYAGLSVLQYDGAKFTLLALNQSIDEFT